MKKVWNNIKDGVKKYTKVVVDKIWLIKHDSLSCKFSDESNQYNLTPIFIEKTLDGKPNPKYGTVRDIASKMGNKDVRNIALTGPYGAGKSSIIRTLERDYPQAKYLNISLATLQDDTFFKEIHDQPNNGNTLYKTKDEMNHLIEYSILQQIIYKEKAQKLKQSRLKRIQNISNSRATILSILFITAVIAVIALFQPKVLMVDSLRNYISCNKNGRLIWDLACVIYLISFSIYVLRRIIISTHNLKITKLNIKDGEIGIEENSSIFNKHLDEIIYFFEVTKYNVVVIEDLDRFDTTHIFLKLRELNQLLNASNSIHRRIVFIYAIRDDMFKDTNRTKFFDYIATVIPVINSSNACDMLKKALKDKGVSEDEISDKTCKDLGLYIDEMRILYNIVDEYLQYRTKIGENLNAKKLLGIIVYKNYFPDDFSDLHNRKGTVFSIISHKKQYLDELTNNKKEELEKLIKQYKEDTDRYKLINGKELRTLFLAKYLLQIDQKVLFFVDGNDKATPQQLIDDETKFKKLINDQYTHIEYFNPNGWPNSVRTALTIKFKQVENSLDERFGYEQRLNYKTEILVTENDSIEMLKSEIGLFQQLPLAHLLCKADIKSFQTDLSKIKDKNKLIEFLLKQGYVDEYYYDYISYFYPGTLTPDDKDFITTLRVGRRMDYGYKLNKIESVISEIPERSYVDGGVLNISLVKHLTEHIDEDYNETILDKTLSCIKRRKEQEFVAEFYKEYPDCATFFVRLFNKWPKFDMDCLYNKETDDDFRYVPTQLEAFLRYVDLRNIGQDDHYIDPKLSRIFGWINTHINIIGINRINDIIQTRSICFDNITVDNVDSDLMSLVSSGLYYEYTEENLKQIVRFHSPEKIENYEKKSLSVLLELNNPMLVDDVKKNISDYIRCFPETSIEESESSLQLILNTAPLDGPSKDYLLKQTQKIKDLSIVSENERKIFALKSNVVNPTWQNINCFVAADEENINNGALPQFIDSNIDALSYDDHSAIQNELGQKLFSHFIGCDILSLPTYIKFRKCFNYILTNTDLSNIDRERISFLVETRCIKLNSYYFDFIKNEHPQLAVSFIVNNKETYFENPSNYSIDTQIAIGLLEHVNFNYEEKAQVFYSLSNEIEISNHLANIVCNLFAAGKLDDLGEHEEKLKQFIELSNSLDVKTLALTHYFNRFEVGDSSIKDLLNILGGCYSTIAAQNGQRPRLEKTNYNKMLIDSLLRKKYISSYADKESYYKVNTRNID